MSFFPSFHTQIIKFAIAPIPIRTLTQNRKKKKINPKLKHKSNETFVWFGVLFVGFSFVYFIIHSFKPYCRFSFLLFFFRPFFSLLLFLFDVSAYYYCILWMFLVHGPNQSSFVQYISCMRASVYDILNSYEYFFLVRFAGKE